ncbi:hypothetical protein AJ88_37630 [Mesorhizobium amorphae CCBAU 01583]|nr:hypothetical protein AJ88_37630 [Mesorhizobium amorphae CCBAU 01583]
MPFTQTPFLADGKLDVLCDEINTVSQMNQLGSWNALEAWIDFNDDWATLRPPEFMPVGPQPRPRARKQLSETSAIRSYSSSLSSAG